MLIEDGGRQIPKTFVVAAIAEPPVYLNFYAPFMVPSEVLEKLCVKQSDVPLVHPDGTRAVKGGRGAAASDGSGKPVPEAENF